MNGGTDDGRTISIVEPHKGDRHSFRIEKQYNFKTDAVWISANKDRLNYKILSDKHWSAKLYFIPVVARCACHFEMNLNTLYPLLERCFFRQLCSTMTG